MSGTWPPVWKSFMRSWNCPWMSPQTVTGLLTGCTFDSSIKISFTCRYIYIWKCTLTKKGAQFVLWQYIDHIFSSWFKKNHDIKFMHQTELKYWSRSIPLRQTRTFVQITKIQNTQIAGQGLKIAANNTSTNCFGILI